MTAKSSELSMLPLEDYVGVDNRNNPIRFYYWPIIGKMYRRRVELCLVELSGGDRVLEIGFGSGLTFMNLDSIYKEIHGLDLTAPVDDVMAAFRARQIETFLQSGNVLHMPYADNFFDSILAISILEHLKPDELMTALREIWRVLKPGGQIVYGVPVERPLMVLAFRLLGYRIREHHFSTEKHVAKAAHRLFKLVRAVSMKQFLGTVQLYQVGHFVKHLEGAATVASEDRPA